MVTLSDLHKPIHIRSDEYGNIELRYTTLNDLAFMFELNGLDLPARQVAAQLIHHQLESPRQELETIYTWSDELLLQAAAGWAKSELHHVKYVSPEITSLDAFKQALIGYAQASKQAMSELWTGWHTQVQSVVGLHTESKALVNSIGSALQPSITASIMSTLESVNRPITQLIAFQNQVGVDLERMANLGKMVSAHSLQVESNLQAFVSHGLKFSMGVEKLSQIASQRIHLGMNALESIQTATQRFAQATLGIEQQIQKLTSTFSFDLGTTIGSFISNLPDLSWLIQLHEDLAKAEEVLDATGYGFTGHLWTPAFAISFAKANPKVKGTMITKRLWAWTSSPAFEEQLSQTMQNSSLLRRRWKIVTRALAAHGRRDYIAAVPLLLSQIEGIFADTLIMKKLVASKGGKLLIRKDDKTLKLDKNGKPIEVRGLSQLVQRSAFQDHEVLSVLVDVGLAGLSRERNPVMHGRRTTFGTAGFSTRLVLMLFVLATEVAEFEKGRIPN